MGKLCEIRTFAVYFFFKKLVFYSSQVPIGNTVVEEARALIKREHPHTTSSINYHRTQQINLAT